MTGKRSESLLLRTIESWGASPRRWPMEAARFTPGPEEEAAIRRESALDAMLDADRAEAALPASLRARILASAPTAAGARRIPPFMTGSWTRAAAVAATLTAGIAAGYAGAAAAFPSPHPEQTLLGLALSAPSDPFAAFMEDGV